ncbi:hypothetical protein [Desulfogranum japonicum]|uniref:hypothetical protein n=1 Tax=Desulfogranum japonicum TaxID=231447 RepID=UPI0004011557|nr:hypothetical protein [Desulfogranum japonicum]
MTIQYLGNEKWESISREERYFCSELFHELNETEKITKFIRFLNGVTSLVPGFVNEIHLNESLCWEVGYEVCLYRDVLYQNNRRIKEVNKERIQNGKDALPQKRTFDLCLFSDKDIVIVEAKSQQGLGSQQCYEFEKEEDYIQELFSEINRDCPKVHLIILASAKYFASPSFLMEKGVGKVLISPKRPAILKGFIAWSQLIDVLNCKNTYLRADEIYKQ